MLQVEAPLSDEENSQVMTDTRILIVVNDGEAGRAYADALGEACVSYDIARSFKDMVAMATDTAYNGLVIDVLTLVRSCKDDKVIAYDCINLYPVLRVKWESREKRINLSLLEQHASRDPQTAFRFFVENRCSTFAPRTLRKFKRKQIHLNAMLSPDENFAPEETEKTFSVTLSQGGAFLHTVKEFEPECRLFVRFADLVERAPIAVQARWSLRWGMTRSIPGIGVSFESLSGSQEQEIEPLLA
jgi:hypothetical protein